MKNRKFLWSHFLTALPVLVTAAMVSFGSGESSFFNQGNEEWTYADYRSVLQHVDDSGMVNYEGLKANRAILDHFAISMAKLQRSTYESWNRLEKSSFWMNAYNSLTLLAIVNHYPIEASFLASLRFPENSIRQISGVWDRLDFSVMGKPLTLDTIEHEILRRDFDDPRVHFSLVCAAMGCPPLRNEPYEGSSVNQQLDDQVYRFLRNPRNFHIDRQRSIVYLSKILDWYGDDFIRQFGIDSIFKGHSQKDRAILNFFSGYLSDKDNIYLRNGDYRIRYLDYDWSLNERKTSSAQQG